MRPGNPDLNPLEPAAEWDITRREFLKRASSAAAAAAVLAGSVSPWSLLAAGTSTSPVGGFCTGTVTDKGTGRPIAGALVSDGAQIVRTARDGKYALKVAPHVRPIVYVTVPDGYCLDPNGFWKPVKFNAGKAAANFSLAPRKRVKKFVFVQVTDTHHIVGTHSPQNIATFIKDVHAFKPAPEFVINTGDLPMGVDGKRYSHKDCIAQYDGFVDVFKPLKSPLLKVIGNHDCALSLPKHLGDYHKGLYRRYFGPLNYSFDYGDIHFVALDANIDAGPTLKPGKWLDGTFDVFDKTALAWLQKDLAFQPKGKPVVLFTHQPPWGQKNFGRLVEILKPHNFRSAFAGHWHRNNTLQERTRSGLGPFVVSGALYCYGGTVCPDGMWRGYRVVAVDGQDVRSCYTAIDRPFQSPILNINVRRRAQHPVNGKAEVLMDILDIDRKLTGVGCAINNGPAVAMTSKPRTKLWARWRGLIDTGKVANGKAKLVFTPRTAAGKWRYEFPVVVKNAGVTLLHPETVAVA